ncbi:MAG: hypothetical protein IT379_23425 [Deltaproteobacteria bacterium]|nr:hypothetical protein [Deltaproteobacteria bacterium]
MYRFLFTLREQLTTTWLVVASLVVLAALLTLVLTRFASLRALGQVVRGLRSHDVDAPGQVAPWLAAASGAAVTGSAATFVAVASAITLAGSGVLVWLWLFVPLAIALRHGEAVLARSTGARGPAGELAGSLSVRLRRDDAAAARVLGWVLVVAVVLAAIAMGGATQGVAIAETTRAMPGGGDIGRWVATAVAVGAIVLTILPRARAWKMGGLVAVIGLALALVASLAAFLADPIDALATVLRAMREASSDAGYSGSFLGASKVQILAAAAAVMLPALAAPTGVTGTFAWASQARTTRLAAAATAAEVIVPVAIASIAGLALVGTGAFGRTVPDEIGWEDVRVHREGIASVAERDASERWSSDLLRVRNGNLGGTQVLANERGPIESPELSLDGRAGDFAIALRDGRAERFLLPGRFGLDDAPLDRVLGVRVRGTSNPTGAAALREATAGMGGAWAGWAWVLAFVALGAAGIAGWGQAVERSVGGTLPVAARHGLRVLPALGVLAIHVVPESLLRSAGNATAALAVAVAAVGVLVGSRAVARATLDSRS